MKTVFHRYMTYGSQKCRGSVGKQTLNAYNEM